MEKSNTNYYETLDILKSKLSHSFDSQSFTYAQVASDNKVTKKSPVTNIRSKLTWHIPQDIKECKTTRNVTEANISVNERKKDDSTTPKSLIIQNIGKNKRMGIRKDENSKILSDVSNLVSISADKELDEDSELILQ